MLTLVFKIDSMKDLVIEREDLQSKTLELEKLIVKTRQFNKHNYHEKDLKITITQAKYIKYLVLKLYFLLANNKCNIFNLLKH